MTDTSITLLDGQTKGLPAGTHALSREAIAGAGWNMLREDLPLPLARAEGVVTRRTTRRG